MTVGGVPSVDLKVTEEGWLSAMVQGGPAGDALVVVTDSEAHEVGALIYEGPVDPAFDRVAAFGASFTQGTQDGVPHTDSMLASPAMVLARQTGSFMPTPLIKRGLFPHLEVTDIGEPPQCLVPGIVSFVAGATATLIGELLDEETGLVTFTKARMDPTMSPSNVAVGGSRIGDLVQPTTDFGVIFMQHLSLSPESEISDPVTMTQLDYIEALDPTMVVSFDLYGNDLINAVVLGSQGVALDELTTVEEFQPSLDALLARLGALSAEVFLANLPDATLSARAKGKEGPDLDLVSERVLLFNDLLAQGALDYPNVHVVDLYGWVEDLPNGEMFVGDEVISTAEFDGLLSLDGVHLTDTGYALMAAEFIDVINAELGTDVALPDLEAIYVSDIRSPESLLEQGLDGAMCD